MSEVLTIKELAQAIIDGATIERLTFDDEWIDINGEGFINTSEYKYRLKPEPLVLYANVYAHGFGSAYVNRNECVETATTNVVRVGVRFIEDPNQE